MTPNLGLARMKHLKNNTATDRINSQRANAILLAVLRELGYTELVKAYYELKGWKYNDQA